MDTLPQIGDSFELALAIGLLILLSPLLGGYMAKIFNGQRTALHPLLGRLELMSYKFSGVNPQEEMSWRTYFKTVILFHLIGFCTLFLILISQGLLPLNPQNFPSLPWPLAFNIAASFTTNTNWQSYIPESTLSHFSQMVGLTSQNFLSSAAGMAILMAIIRGINRKGASTIGNFWADLTRAILYIFLPLSIIFALALAREGVIQTLSEYTQVTTLENDTQLIPSGLAASQVAIKQLGSNGGGFFNANSAHPFENPTGFTNFLETIAILLIPTSSIYTYGVLIKSKRHAFLLFSVMICLFLAGLLASIWSQSSLNPILDIYPNFEGLETRFGVNRSLLWSVSTTATANGSVNSMLSSLSPLTGGIALFNITMGELIFGGVGVGLCSIIMFALLTVFLSGLMVGRTPEYLGKKIEVHEIQWVVFAVLTPSALMLIGSGITFTMPEFLGNLNRGPHGLTEVIYSFASAAANNGSSFAGLNSNTNYYNITLGLVMLAGRLAFIMPSLAIAGLLARKNITPPTLGTFSTNTLIFALLLINIIVTVAALTFFPILSLGPILEEILMHQGRSF